jgi:parallel beta-helix repeat protein
VWLLVIGGFFYFITFDSGVVNAGITIYVDDDNTIGPWDGTLANPYQKIQEGVNAAIDGDTVYVFAGSYYDNVVVNKTINLIGEKKDFTIIFGIGGDVVKITKDWVNFTGFTISRPITNVGLRVESNYNTISGNTVEINGIGILLHNSIGNNITDNEMIESGFHIIGNQLEHWNTHNIDISNTVNGKSVYYWKNQNAGTIPSDAGQVFLANCTNVIIEDQDISNVSYGIELGFSFINNIINNTVKTFWNDGIIISNSDKNNIINNNVSNSDRGMGISLGSSNFNNITSNYVYSNYFEGIYLNNSSNNNIVNNHASYNSDGISLIQSDENYIMGNTGIFNYYYGGIYLLYSSNNTIQNNICNSNGNEGIRLDLYSHLNIIKNNTCNSNRFGIDLWYSDDNIIYGNTASDNIVAGIWLVLTSFRNNITNNTASGNSMWGINLGNSSNNNINNNKIHNNSENGIYLVISSNNTIANNSVLNNANGIWVRDLSNNNIVTDNNFTNNNMGVYLTNSHENNIDSNNILMNNEDGIKIYNSLGNKIINNIVSNNNDGIFIGNLLGENDIEGNIISSNSRNGIGIFWYSNENNIRFNNISNNLIGINISTYSDDNIMTANDISNNLYGVVMNSTDSNTFTRNNFISNTVYAIDIRSGEFNFIYHNNFIDNNGGGVQASDKTGMTGWNAIYPIGGNYWNDWTTPDIKSGPNQDQIGSDGFVDVPYSLDGGSGEEDRYPFAIPMDFSPPIITNLQPPDGSLINNNAPLISANYSDPSGIDTSSVVLIVNGIDVTLSATITATGVGYIPGTALSDGIYTVYLEVKDTFGNLATETWSFTVDATPPDITNLQPPDASIINYTNPIISADYNDPSGINASSVVLMVDGIDITLFAFVTISGVSYIPGMVLSDGVHTVYIEVKDNVGNLAFVTWTLGILHLLHGHSRWIQLYLPLQI